MSGKYNLRQMADTNWTSDTKSNEDIQTGCLLKIADNIEKMAQNHNQLVSERDRYERWYNDEVKKNRKLYYSNKALRGVITRMKRKAGKI